ncbi:sodium:solute symporter family protein [Aquimarina gracilis]|uniref:Sodium:solute symporter family protein n=1 Tax=Aquimarina gracilis TaxID=874422 RepID=A0ABU5ZWE3_9FLAO|nr:sodium:solute symporter family protein [Aquimarina gracilis]MEB3346171.1 sodium:solute symporter family protein [Aquimarina gracilis]
MITLSTLDLVLIFSFFAITLAIGIWVSKKSGKNTSEFFLSGRNMPWWLLGLSMVATTFSTDTPNLVTDIVRKGGVSGNWAWWAFLITGLLTVFVYAKLWRKSNVNTDIEFYDLRYGGKPAHFLRGFRAIYLGVIFNVLAMSGVTLAAIKISQVMLGLDPLYTVGIAALITVTFSAVGGFRGVVYTDFVLFFTAMIGAIGAAYYCVNLPEVDGISNLIVHPQVIDKISLLPDFDNTELLITLLIIPLAVQWWSSWYPGGEPGGGGYIAQRMLAAKDENHAIGATFFFNIMHYALRPWPWILVALASLVLYPKDDTNTMEAAKHNYIEMQKLEGTRALTVEEKERMDTYYFASEGLTAIREAFPEEKVQKDKIGHDLAYSAMLTRLPSGLLGLVLASLIAAFMSTISTHLNWGSSYIVNDFYIQQVNKNASEKELVLVGRISTAVLMLISTVLALKLTNAKQIFDYIIMFGAGTGLIFILRWFWWRINAWSEISGMFASGIVSIIFNLESVNLVLFEEGPLPGWSKYLLVVGITTIIWLAVTFLTKPEDSKVLFNFYKKTQPGGPGWSKTLQAAKKQNIDIKTDFAQWSVPSGILAMLVGCVLIYGVLFATGYWIYGKYLSATILTIVVIIATYILNKLWKKIKSTIL